jgi:hypothetical protein
MGAKLHVLRLDLPGLWSDGWLYKEHLLLWSRDGRLHVVRLADLAAEIKELGTPPLEAVADHLLFHTEWKTGAQFSQLLLIPGIEEKFVAGFPETGEIIVPIDKAFPVPVSTDPVPGVILDSAIYANRVYLGTIDGLFETRFDPDSPAKRNPLVERMEKRVSVISAGFSAVNGSAGEDGLWFGRMHFGDEPWWSEKSTWRQVAEFSRSNSFADVNLLNYTGDAFPRFLRSETSKEKQHGNSEREDRQITGYREPADIGGLMTSALRKKRSTRYHNSPELDLGLDDGSAEVLGNSGKRLLVTWDDSLRVVDLSAQPDRDLSAKQDKAFQTVANLEIDPYAILDTHAFGKGFLVELSKEVRLISSQGSFTLISEPVARIRTFARSRRYKEVVLLIRETGVSLLGMYISQGGV